MPKMGWKLLIMLAVLTSKKFKLFTKRVWPTAVVKTASIKVIKEQMRHDNSNVSRLIDTLKTKELVERATNENDRRAVDIGLTKRGLKIIKAAVKDIEKLNRSIIQTDPAETKHINELLKRIQGVI